MKMCIGCGQTNKHAPSCLMRSHAEHATYQNCDVSRSDAIQAVRQTRWRLLVGVLSSLLPGSIDTKVRRLWSPAYRAWYDLEDHRTP